MDTTKNNATAGTVASQNTSSDTHSTPKLRKGTKREAVMRAFVELGAQGLTCFEAVYLCRDYVLRSTVSDLHRELGITFARKHEALNNEFNTHCVRYWLEPSERTKVAAMLGEVGA